MLQLATRSLSFFLAKIIIHIKETEKYLPKPFVLRLTNSKWPITHTHITGNLPSLRVLDFKGYFWGGFSNKAKARQQQLPALPVAIEIWD